MSYLIKELISQTRMLGHRSGIAGRKLSKSQSSAEGLKVGAERNAGQERYVVNRDDEEKRLRKKTAEKRTKEAEKRSKETLKLAQKENVSEAKFIHDKPMASLVKAYSGHDVNHLKQLHARWSASHNNPKSNPDTSEKLLAVHQVLKNKGESPADLPKHKNLGMHTYNEETNTEKRERIKNVARPDDPKPTESDKLSRQAQIKTKIIDEDKTMALTTNFGLPASLVAAAIAIMEKKADKKDDDIKSIGKDTNEVDLEPKTNDDVNDDGSEKVSKKCPICGKNPCKCKSMKEETELNEKTVSDLEKQGYKKVTSSNQGWTHHYEHPETGKRVKVEFGNLPHQVKSITKEETELSPKQKKIAAVAGNPKKIDAADFKALRAGKKVEEEVETVDEVSKPLLKKYIERASSDASRHAYMSGKTGDISHAEKASKRHRGIIKATDKLTKEDLDDLTEEQLQEVLNKSDPAGKWISDFVHSDDPKFAGKSKKERMKMALGAYYAKQRNEEVEFSCDELARLKEIAKKFN